MGRGVEREFRSISQTHAVWLVGGVADSQLVMSIFISCREINALDYESLLPYSSLIS